MAEEEPDQRTAKQKAWDEQKAASPQRHKLAAKRRTREASRILDAVMSGLPRARR